MSKGAGIVERRIADLLAATRDRALSIDEIVDNAYELNGAKPTRAQRLSATRAAHRVLQRAKELDDQRDQAIKRAHARTATACPGLKPWEDAYQAIFDKDPDYILCRKLSDRLHQEYPTFGVGTWLAETVKRRLYFHLDDVPVRVWAVSMSIGGITWAEVDEITKITARNVMVKYASEFARLDRRYLAMGSAWWRGVRFVSSRTGYIAKLLDEQWWERYGARVAGAIPPSMQMPLVQAMAMLGVPANYTREDVMSGYRRAAKKAHPDVGGTAEMFRKLTEARDRLLAALGTSAPPPKPPRYAPKGEKVFYRSSSSSSQARLGKAPRRLR